MSLDLGDVEAKLKFQIIYWGGGGGVVSSNLLNIRDWTVWWCIITRQNVIGKSGVRLEYFLQGYRHSDGLDLENWLCLIWPCSLNVIHPTSSELLKAL